MALLTNVTHADWPSPGGPERLHTAQALIRRTLRTYAVKTLNAPYDSTQDDAAGTRMLQAAADRDEASVAGYEANADLFGNGDGSSGFSELPAPDGPQYLPGTGWEDF